MKRILILVMVAAFLITAVGCSGEANEVVEPEKVGTSADVSETLAHENSTELKPRQDQERMGLADIYGNVLRIVGNEVTIQLIEMPEMNESSERLSGNGQAQGRMREGGNKQEPKFTGETVQMIIPVGVSIVSRTSEGQEELDISDITSGSMLMVWTDEAGEPKRIQLLGMR